MEAELGRGQKATVAAAVVDVADAEKKAKRRERRHAEQLAKRAAADRQAEADRQRRERQLASRSEAPAEAEAGPVVATVAPEAITEHPRSPMLTPAEAARFDDGDAWVGGVVLAFVPFEGRDPGQPTMTGKVRPAVVVAANASHLLVRGCYSPGGSIGRSIQGVQIGGWRQAGLDGPSIVADDRVEVERSGLASPMGWLSIADWNLLW